MSKKTVVVLGAGYAGLRTVKQLQKKNLEIEIILVDKNDYHCESMLLHEVAAGTSEKEDITFKIKKVIDEKKVTFIQDTVTVINREEKTVSLANHEALVYDYLVVGLGFESESFGIKGVDEHGWPLVNISTAEKAREVLETNLANYQHSQDEKDLSIVVCGAGFTSIEYLGEITNRIPTLADELNFPPHKVKITCIEAMPQLLPMFSRELADYGMDVLEKRGVIFEVGKPIKELKADAVVYEDEGELKEVAANTIIWTTGVSGSRIVGQSGFNERRGRVMVNADLTVPEHPEVYIIGDVSAVMDQETDRPYPTTAQIALVQADQVAKNIELELKGQAKEDFVFKSSGTVASIGDNQAIANVANMDFKGYIASVMKKGVTDKVLLTVATPSLMIKKGKFDFWH